MRKFYCFIPFLLFMLTGMAQKKKTAQSKKEENFADYSPVEIKAQFPGGEAAWMEYINNTNRIDSIYESIGEGVNAWTINVVFTISEKGQIEVTEMKGDSTVHPAFKDELRRLFESSPKWVPAKQRDKPIKSLRSQKINFVFTEEKPGAKKPD